METMERKQPRARRSFTAEFKAEFVELCQRGDRSIGQVARDFDLTETAVREWVRQAERDAETRGDGGLTSSERQELWALRRENQRLRQDVEILKRAALGSIGRCNTDDGVVSTGRWRMAQRGRPGLSPEQKRELWSRWKAGESLSEIGRALGKQPGSIHGVVASNGGYVPAVRRRSPRVLTITEREEISRGLAESASLRRIAGAAPPGAVEHQP